MSIQVKHSLTGTLTSKMGISGAMNVGALMKEELKRFEGPYTVTPTITKQTLNTKEKAMTNDLVIESIPYAEVTNSANGLTVTIGG